MNWLGTFTHFTLMSLLLGGGKGVTVIFFGGKGTARNLHEKLLKFYLQQCNQCESELENEED